MYKEINYTFLLSLSSALRKCVCSLLGLRTKLNLTRFYLYF